MSRVWQAGRPPLRDADRAIPGHRRGGIMPRRPRPLRWMDPRAGPRTRPGMGALPYDGGTTFRVWAPHADAVFVTGTFDDWAARRARRSRGTATGPSGTWSADVAGVGAGREYRFTIRTPDGDLSRMDPYARQVTNSVGNGVVYDPARLRLGRRRVPAARLGRPRDLRDARRDVRRHARTGGGPSTPRAGGCLPARARRVSAIQVMPPFEFAGDISWGYNPAHLFAIESGLRRARTPSSGSSATPTRTASPSSSTSSTTTSARRTSTCGGSTAGREGDGGGIYFYNDERAHDAVGRDPPRLRPRRGPDVPARQRADLARGVPLRRPALRRDAVHPRRRRRCPATRRPRSPTAGRSWPGSTTRSARASRGRSRSPRTSRATRRSWRRRRRAAPASARSGSRRSSTTCGRRSTAHDDADRDVGRVAAAIVGEGRGRARDAGHLHGVARRRGQRACPRARGHRTRATPDSWWAKKRADAGVGAGAHVARHPDAVPGPGAAGGPVVRRHGRPRLARRRSPTAGSCACTATSSRCGAPGTARPTGLRGPERRGSCAPTTTAKVLVMHRWLDGRPARRRGGRRELRRPARSTTCASGLPAPGPVEGAAEPGLGGLRAGLRRPRGVRPRRRRRSRSTAASRAGSSPWARTAWW